MRRVELWNRSCIYWNTYMVVHSMYHYKHCTFIHILECVQGTESIYCSILSVWESDASPGEHTRDILSLGDSQILVEERNYSLGRLRACGNYWKELGNIPELQRPLCIILEAGSVILHDVVPSSHLESIPLMCYSWLSWLFYNSF